MEGCVQACPPMMAPSRCKVRVGWSQARQLPAAQEAEQRCPLAQSLTRLVAFLW